MSSYFVVSIRFFDPRFHGRSDGGRPEWPPSPLRVFQALVAAAGARARGRNLTDKAQCALRWLEGLSDQNAPLIIAPVMAMTEGYRLSVPNNAMDIVASAWARGNESNTGDSDPRTHRTMKTVRPTHFIEGDSVHFLWRLSKEQTRDEQVHVEVIIEITQSLVALGWGVDMVIGNATVLSEAQADNLVGERWLPSAQDSEGLRVPVIGTIDALVDRHRRFLERLGDDGGFTAPPPLTIFKVIAYQRSDEPVARDVAAFALRDVENDQYCSFDTVRHGLTVIGHLRHATYEAAKVSKAGDWSRSQMDAFILGHGEERGASHVSVGDRRFAYMPLPSIESLSSQNERVGDIRRVVVTTFTQDYNDEIAWARRALSGQELIDERSKKATAVLEVISANESMVQRYVRAADSWATVTPVVLPGYDDPRHYRTRLKNGPPPDEQKHLLSRLSERIDGLIRKAIMQAGFPKTLAEHALIDWRKVGFWPGADLADRYGVPDHLRRFPRYHVRIDWRATNGRPLRLPGPICIGAGRFIGLGLFASRRLIPSGSAPGPLRGGWKGTTRIRGDIVQVDWSSDFEAVR